MLLFSYDGIYFCMLNFSAGFSEDSDYTSDLNFPVNGQIPNAATSQYLPVALNAQGNQGIPAGDQVGLLQELGNSDSQHSHHESNQQPTVQGVSLHIGFFFKWV